MPRAFFTFFVIDGNKTVKDENGNWVLAPDESEAIAVYNGKGYMSLQSAIDAAGSSPANVSLVGNTTEAVTIPASANIAIDIAEGVTLTGTDSGHAITNNGTLTVTGEGTVKAMASSKGAVENFGTANLKGAKFTREVYTPGGNWYVLDNQGTMNISDTAYVYAEAPDASLIRNLGTSLDQKATLNISGGVITQNEFIAVKNDDYGVLNITGGTITSVEQAVQNWHQATITGGTISGPVISWAYGDKLGMDSTLDISGTAVVIGDVMSVTYDGAVPQVAITGGTVNGKLVKGQYVSNAIQPLPNDSDKADIVVSGGTFNNAVPEEFCAENFHPNRNPDGSYSVHTHQFGPWVTTVRPGHTTSGTEVQTCTVCGYEIARTIAPTGNNDHPDIEQAKQDGTWGQEETSTPAPTATAAPAAGSVNTVPQTGDEMPLTVLGGAAALAAAAMVVLILRKRRVF
ncbi:MAG TPA: LPXTG cell wall anchor domain-containing protein [Candidatus Gemmiger faecavium]|nr:LPXTG cell wall anchor domain-containing protein [Candidatus Gemmiger faecavium]